MSCFLTQGTVSTKLQKSLTGEQHVQNLSCGQVCNKTSEMWKKTTNQPSSRSQIMGRWNWQLQRPSEHSHLAKDGAEIGL